MSELVLETEKLEKIYKLGGRTIRALSDINLKVEKGDFVSIMGPSGSAKLHCLTF
jgi:ABC-type antimicrobial peptide transport system, ATPase component